MKTLIIEIITLVVFWPLRIVSRLFGRRANARVREWQDNTWTWWLGAAAVGYMASDHYTGDGGQSISGLDHGHFDGGHHGGHDAGGGFDGGGFGGDIGGIGGI
ncbi:MAG: hypothetical protein F4Y69_00595 [Chloroflexi bacterium]|nr:hypothetical protein [Chloroflexota bacterium]MYF21152.1 hypothetical protein [Chloroflexota bacterium]